MADVHTIIARSSDHREVRKHSGDRCVGRADSCGIKKMRDRDHNTTNSLHRLAVENGSLTNCRVYCATSWLILCFRLRTTGIDVLRWAIDCYAFRLFKTRRPDEIALCARFYRKIITIKTRRRIRGANIKETLIATSSMFKGKIFIL